MLLYLFKFHISAPLSNPLFSSSLLFVAPFCGIAPFYISVNPLNFSVGCAVPNQQPEYWLETNSSVFIVLKGDRSLVKIWHFNLIECPKIVYWHKIYQALLFSINPPFRFLPPFHKNFLLPPFSKTLGRGFQAMSMIGLNTVLSFLSILFRA